MVIAHISNDVLDWVLPPFPGHAVGLKAVMEVGGRGGGQLMLYLV